MTQGMQCTTRLLTTERAIASAAGDHVGEGPRGGGGDTKTSTLILQS
jgi:hypothetical protein